MDPTRPQPSLYDTALTASISDDQRFNDIAQLLVALGRALHEVGQPSHKIEETLVRAAEKFDVPLQVFSLPTGQLLSFHHEDGPLTFVLRMQSGAIHLDRLSQLLVLAERLIQGSITPFAARARIERTMRDSGRRMWFPTTSAYVLSAAPFAVFFGGGWREVVVATCVGLAAGLIAVAMKRIRTTNRLFELSAAAAATAIAGSADWLLGAYSGWIPLAAGLIILLPGIALVDSLEELASGHLVSGGSRLAGVGVVFLALIFGSVVGFELAATVPSEEVKDPESLPYWTIVPALLVVAVGSTIRFRARFADVSVILVASTVALLGSQFGKYLVGQTAGPFFAALALGSIANLYARWSHRPAELLVVPGLALLVPGSVGIKSVQVLLSEHARALLDVNTAFQMFLIGIALVAGLLASDWLVRDRSPS